MKRIYIRKRFKKISHIKTNIEKYHPYISILTFLLKYYGGCKLEHTVINISKITKNIDTYSRFTIKFKCNQMNNSK